MCSLENCSSVCRDCLITTVMKWLQLEQICRHVDHTASARRLPIDWTVGSLEFFKHLQLTPAVTWTFSRLIVVLGDTLATSCLTVSGQHLLLDNHRYQVSESHIQSHLDIPTCTIRLTFSCHARQTLVTHSLTSYLRLGSWSRTSHGRIFNCRSQWWIY